MMEMLNPRHTLIETPLLISCAHKFFILFLTNNKCIRLNHARNS